MAPIFLMMLFKRPIQVVFLCLAGWLASGCANNTPPYVKAIQSLWKYSDQPSLPDQLNMAYRYLRVQANDGPSALLVLGYDDSHPQGLIEVWYSAKQEVIKTQNGRIISTAGLPINWIRVLAPSTPVDWLQVPVQGSTYQRLRDINPSYQTGIAETIMVKPQIGLPDMPLPATLPLASARQLKWFSESSQGRGAPLPTAWFAWGSHRGHPGIVYTRQCLSPQYCLQLQRWPQEPAQP